MFSRKDTHIAAEILSTEPVVTNELTTFSRLDSRLFDTTLPRLERVLDILVSDPDSAYKRIELPKKSGGKRIIHAPIGDAVMEEGERREGSHSLLSFLQKRINIILGMVLLPKQICAFRYGIDPYVTLRNLLDGIRGGASTNSVARIGGMFKVDIKDFFNSITEEQVKNVWLIILPQIYKGEVTPGVIDILVLLSCYNGQLNQGPPSSPMLSNIVGYHEFESNYLREVEKTQGRGRKSVWMRYLRYADDIVVLSINGKIPENIPDLVKGTIEKGGFKVAEQKTQLLEDAEGYPILGISLKKDYVSGVGFQFQIGTQRDKSTASEILGFSPEDSKDSLRGKVIFNNRISTLGRSGHFVEQYNGIFSRRVAHALRLQGGVDFLQNNNNNG